MDIRWLTLLIAIDEELFWDLGEQADALLRRPR
jgi:hypothetical protein